MVYDVVFKKKIAEELRKLPLWTQKKMVLLVRDLKESGPEQSKWQNYYSRLSETEYHCHLGTSWVACWRNYPETLTIEVYYVGCREKAPF